MDQPDTNQIDIRSFQVEVLRELDRLLELEKLEDEVHALRQSGGISLLDPSSWATLLLWWRKKPDVARTEAAKEQARQLIANRRVLDSICPALKSLTDDVFEIAKVLGSVLYYLHFSGDASVPIEPLTIAAMASIIAKTTVAALCAEVDKAEKTRKTSMEQ